MKTGCFQTSIRRLGLAAMCFGLWSTAGCVKFPARFPDEVPVVHQAADGGEFRVGSAFVDITPESDVWMGGFSALRRSRGIHDPLYARAIVLERGDLRLALVALDLVGLQREEVERIKERVSGFDRTAIVLSSTHTHGAPDTLGFWGFPPLMTGIDRSYMKKLQESVLEALRLAEGSLRPAEFSAGSMLLEPEGLFKNLTRPGVVDRELVVFHFRERGGGASIATLVELGVHPEVVGKKNRQITPDFPRWALELVETELGGVGIYVSGALGGLVTPDVKDGFPEGDGGGFEEAERVGKQVGERAIEVVRGLDSYESRPRLEWWHAPIYLQNENIRYTIGRWANLLDRRIYRGGFFKTELNLWQIGSAQLATIPGEITPSLGLRIKRVLEGSPVMLVGLANDELGYFLPRSEYDLPIYRYERTFCVGRDAGDRILRRFEDLGLMEEQDQLTH